MRATPCQSHCPVANPSRPWPRPSPSHRLSPPSALRGSRQPSYTTSTSSSSSYPTFDDDKDDFTRSFHAQMAELRARGVSLYEVGDRFLSPGSMGEDVRELQEYLKAEGYFSSSKGCTGYFGEHTRDALIRWQEANEVPPTGGFGELSRKAYLELAHAYVEKAFLDGKWGLGKKGMGWGWEGWFGGGGGGGGKKEVIEAGRNGKRASTSSKKETLSMAPLRSSPSWSLSSLFEPLQQLSAAFSLPFASNARTSSMMTTFPTASSSFPNLPPSPSQMTGLSLVVIGSILLVRQITEHVSATRARRDRYQAFLKTTTGRRLNSNALPPSNPTQARLLAGEVAAHDDDGPWEKEEKQVPGIVPLLQQVSGPPHLVQLPSSRTRLVVEEAKKPPHVAPIRKRVDLTNVVPPSPTPSPSPSPPQSPPPSPPPRSSTPPSPPSPLSSSHSPSVPNPHVIFAERNRKNRGGVDPTSLS